MLHVATESSAAGVESLGYVSFIIRAGFFPFSPPAVRKRWTCTDKPAAQNHVMGQADTRGPRGCSKLKLGFRFESVYKSNLLIVRLFFCQPCNMLAPNTFSYGCSTCHTAHTQFTLETVADLALEALSHF